MDSRARETIARRVLALSNADQTEVLVSVSDASLTRFTHQMSNQNVAASDRSISIRAIVDGRTGVAATNRFDDASLREVLARAIALANLSPIDPSQPLLPAGDATQTPLKALVDATAAADPELRARMCAEIFAQAESAAYWCAGYVSTSLTGYTIVNSSGTVASFDGTEAAVNVKMTAPDSTGFAESYSSDVSAIDAAAVGKRSVMKARRSAAPRNVDPGEWTVILEPAAFGELLSYATTHFSAQAFDEGSSFFAGSLGKRMFPEDLNIWDDYAHPLAPGMPFDFEGQPTERLALIERGIVRNIVTDSYYAHKLDRPNTGHALPAPNAWGPQAQHVVVGVGSRSVDALIASTERGLLVTRFWYIRTVDQKQAIVTGMTRDGTFLIEDGALVGGVRNMRFNQSVIEALRNATFASEQVRTGGIGYSIVTPAARIERFAFTSGTEF